MKKTIIAALIASAALAPVAASAQAAASSQATIAVGTKVLGKDGAEIGLVERIEGANVVISVGQQRATVPANSLAPANGALQFSMTRGELEAAMSAGADKAKASLGAALVASAPVTSKDGQPVGTVEKVEGDNVTLKLSSGNQVALGKTFFSLSPAGALQISLTATEFQTAAASAAAAADGDGSAATEAEAAATGE